MKSALRARIVTALLLAAVVIVVLVWLPPEVAVVLISVAIFGAGFEWAGFVRLRSRSARLSYAAAILLALTALQFAIGNFLDPYMMGNSLNLSPFAILISLAVWSELWGVPGAFLAVPITAILTIVFSEFPGTRPIAVLLSRGGRL